MWALARRVSGRPAGRWGAGSPGRSARRRCLRVPTRGTDPGRALCRTPTPQTRGSPLGSAASARMAGSGPQAVQDVLMRAFRAVETRERSRCANGRGLRGPPLAAKVLSTYSTTPGRNSDTPSRSRPTTFWARKGVKLKSTRGCGTRSWHWSLARTKATRRSEGPASRSDRDGAWSWVVLVLPPTLGCPRPVSFRPSMFPVFIVFARPGP